MVSCYLILCISFINSLCDFHVYSCDYTCADKPVFIPSILVVKYGDPANATCVVCKEACHGTFFGLETIVGEQKENGTTLLWTVDSLTEWDTMTMCYYNTDAGEQCCSILAVTVYQPQQYVTISFANHTGPMFEGDQFTLQCSVQNVAPVQNLIVTFYRGQTALDHLQSNSEPEKKPVNKTFILTINASREDDGAYYWCEAKLELGPYGPQPPPAVMSEKLLIQVYYGPELKWSPNLALITIAKGNTLHLNCLAVGNPNPSYTWTLASDGSTFYNGSILTITSVGFEHKGQYTCNVSSKAGTVTMKFTVDVRATSPNSAISLIRCILFVKIFGGLAFGTLLLRYCYKHNKMGSFNPVQSL